MSVKVGDAGKIILAGCPRQLSFCKQMTEIISNLIVRQIFRCLPVKLRKALNPVDIASLGMLRQAIKIHVLNKLFSDFTAH